MKRERGNIHSSWWWTLYEHSSALVKLHVHCVPTLVTCTVHNALCMCTLCIVWQCLFQRLLLAGHPRTSVPPPKQLGLPAALPLLVTLHMCVLLIGASCVCLCVLHCVCLCVLLCCHLLASNFRTSLSFVPPLSRSRPSGNKQWEKSSSIFVQAYLLTKGDLQ